MTTIRPFVGPARVSSGPGASEALAAELAAIGISPGAGTVVLVVDAAVLDLGLIDPVADLLRGAGHAVDVRPGVESEPSPEIVEKLIPPAAEAPVAAVVAIGGGSAIDAAKLVALALANPGLDLTAGMTPAADIRPGPPLLAVPTTAGTGAEATAVAMLWHRNGKRMFVHPYLVPRVALLDPTLLTGLPPAVTAAGGLDAISHAVESLLSTWRTPMTERAALSALRRLGGALPAAYEDGGDLAAREATLLGAFEAGLALNASVVIGHSLAYVISERTGLPHGVACAIALPYCLAQVRPAKEEAMAEIAAALCGDEGAGPEDLLKWLVDANVAMGIPGSLDSLGVAADALPAMAAECVEAYPRPNNPVPIEVDTVEALLVALHRGDPSGAWRLTESLA
jgi:alcohol dehydrogenase class IV